MTGTTGRIGISHLSDQSNIEQVWPRKAKCEYAIGSFNPNIWDNNKLWAAARWLNARKWHPCALRIARKLKKYFEL